VTPVFIARFVATAVPQVWHGYPISHRDDTPPEHVLNCWLQAGLFTPAKIKKITSRKPCNL
jgi:hypothetical protein